MPRPVTTQTFHPHPHPLLRLQRIATPSKTWMPGWSASKRRGIFQHLRPPLHLLHPPRHPLQHKTATRLLIWLPGSNARRKRGAVDDDAHRHTSVTHLNKSRHRALKATAQTKHSCCFDPKHHRLGIKGCAVRVMGCACTMETMSTAQHTTEIA